MAIDAKTLAAAKKYTKETVEGAGAIKGKNCVIDSIVPITGGNRVTFKWTLDNGTVQTGTMDVMDGTDGAPGAQGPQGPYGPAGADGADGLGIKSVDINEENHLIITYDDNTTHDAGEIPGGGSGGVISVNGKNGVVKLYATDINMSDDPSAKTIALSISELQGSMATKASQSDVTQIQLDISALQGSMANKVDKEAGKGLSTNDYTMADMQKLAALLGIKSAGSGLNFDSTTGELTATGAAITIDSSLDESSPNAIQNQAVAIPIHALQGSMSNKADKSDTYTKTQVDNALTAKLDANKVGAANGAAPLGSDSKVPAANLPSYVDDVEEYASKSAFPVTGESGKIYVDLSDNKTYRWSGSTYVTVGNDLALGETSSTAYAGDKGKANADAISAIKDGSSIDSFADVESALNGKENTISDLSTIRSGASAGATAYQKPGTGIPKSDMASDVQNSLGKADTAIQDISGKADKTDLDSWVGPSYANNDGDVTFDNLDDTQAYKLFGKDKLLRIDGQPTKTTGTTSGTVKVTYKTDASNGLECWLRVIKK